MKANPMLNLDHHLARLRLILDEVEHMRISDRMEAGDAAELASKFLAEAGNVASLFVQEQVARLTKQPFAVPIGHRSVKKGG